MDVIDCADIFLYVCCLQLQPFLMNRVYSMDIIVHIYMRGMYSVLCVEVSLSSVVYIFPLNGNIRENHTFFYCSHQRLYETNLYFFFSFSSSFSSCLSVMVLSIKKKFMIAKISEEKIEKIHKLTRTRVSPFLNESNLKKKRRYKWRYTKLALIHNVFNTRKKQIERIGFFCRATIYLTKAFIFFVFF